MNERDRKKVEHIHGRRAIAFGIAALTLAGCGIGNEPGPSNAEQSYRPPVIEEVLLSGTYNGMCGMEERRIAESECLALPRIGIKTPLPAERDNTEPIEIASVKNGVFKLDNLTPEYQAAIGYAMGDPIVKKVNETTAIIFEQIDTPYSGNAEMSRPVYMPEDHSIRVELPKSFSGISESMFKKYYDDFPTVGALAAQLRHESVHSLQDTFGNTQHMQHLTQDVFSQMLSGALEALRLQFITDNQDGVRISGQLDALKVSLANDYRQEIITASRYENYAKATKLLQAGFKKENGLSILIAYDEETGEPYYQSPNTFIANYKRDKKDTSYTVGDRSGRIMGDMMDTLSKALAFKNVLGVITEHQNMSGLSNGSLGHPWDSGWEMIASVINSAQTAPYTLVENLRSASPYLQKAVVDTLQGFGAELNHRDEGAYKQSNISMVLEALSETSP